MVSGLKQGWQKTAERVGVEVEEGRVIGMRRDRVLEQGRW